MTRETLGEVPCYRISTKMSGAQQKRGLNRWEKQAASMESRKERGNKFSGRQHGEHRDTANYESTVERVTGIQYQEVDGIQSQYEVPLSMPLLPTAVKRSISRWRLKRKSIVLQPDFSDPSVFEPPFAEGARISDWDSTNPDDHFRWRDGNLENDRTQRHNCNHY